MCIKCVQQCVTAMRCCEHCWLFREPTGTKLMGLPMISETILSIMLQKNRSEGLRSYNADFFEQILFWRKSSSLRLWTTRPWAFFVNAHRPFLNCWHQTRKQPSAGSLITESPRPSMNLSRTVSSSWQKPNSIWI